MVTQHFGSVAASTVRGFGAEQYPLLIVGLRNRSAMEICSVLQGKVGLPNVFLSNMFLFRVVFNSSIVIALAANKAVSQPEYT